MRAFSTLGVTAALFLTVAAGCVLWSGRASGQSPLPGPTPAQPNPRAGNSVLLDANGLTVQRRRFEPGQRTYWHSHEKGFLILVEKGGARVQRKGEPMKELKEGETDYTPPNVMHWHGASPDQEFVQVGVLFGGGIQFADPVTDAEYAGKTK
jgi:quercetin dioxygenase-like cupin family protein